MMCNPLTLQQELEWQLSLEFERKLHGTSNWELGVRMEAVGCCCDETNPVPRRIKGCLAIL